RIPRSQPLVESGIALADMMPAFAEGSVERKAPARRQPPAELLEHGADRRPAHDVRGVGAEGMVELKVRPRPLHVQHDGRAHVSKLRLLQPSRDAGEVLRQVARLPDQLGHGAAEVYRMLSGAAADLQHRASTGEFLQQHLEYGLLIALASFRIGLHRSILRLACGGIRQSSLSRAPYGAPARTGGPPPRPPATPDRPGR